MNNFLTNKLNAYFIVVGLFVLTLLVAGILTLIKYVPAWIDNREPVELVGIAIEQQDNGNYAEAKKLYERTLIKAPADSPTVYHANRGLMNIALQEGKYQAAQTYFIRANNAIVIYFHLFSDIVDAYKTGPLKDQRKVFEKAFEQACLRTPNDTNFATTFASYYRDIGNNQKAIEWYQFAIDHNAPNSDILQAEINNLQS